MSDTSDHPPKVQDVIKYLGTGESNRKIVTLQPSQTAAAAMEVLGLSGILSAPVVSEQGGFLGIVDVHDMLDLLMESYNQGTGFDDCCARLNEPVEGLLKHKGAPDISFLAEGMGTRRTLEDVVTTKFVANSVHRLAITDCDACVLNIFSQSDVVQYVAAHSDLIGDRASLTLAALGLAKRDVVSISDSSSALEALGTMYKSNVRVVPIMSAAGQLVGQLSTASLRGLNSANLPLLSKPVLEFLSAEKPSAKTQKSALLVPLTVKAEDTFGECVQKLTAASAREAFVVDDAGAVVSIVTQSDILSQIWSKLT